MSILREVTPFSDPGYCVGRLMQHQYITQSYSGAGTYCTELLQITGGYWRLQEITRDY